MLSALSTSAKVHVMLKSAHYSDTVITFLSEPVTLNIYPAVNKRNDDPKIFINTIGIGNKSIILPMIFDTGSAGITMNGALIFPDSIMDTTGFKFNNGLDTIQYQGITITKFTVEKTYGSSGKTVTHVIGNIGYATLTVGDSSGAIKMQRMPILFFYKKTVNGKEKTNPLTGSIFGVNPDYSFAKQVSNPNNGCIQISPLKFLCYSSNLIVGYQLDKITLTGCDINKSGSCLPKALLTIGLTAKDESEYTIYKLNKSRQRLINAWPYTNYNQFDPNINDCIINVGSRKLQEKVLLDTGKPGVIINFSQDILDSASDTTIGITTSSQINFNYNYNTVNFKTVFNPSNNRSIFGIYFFTKFNFMEDYQNGEIGLK